MEQNILKALQHVILDIPTAYSRMMRMLLLNTDIGGGGGDNHHHANPKMMQMARYLLDSTLLSYELLQYTPTQVAAAVVYICRRTLLGDDTSCGWSDLGVTGGSTTPSATTTHTVRHIARAIMDAKSQLTKVDGLRRKHDASGMFGTVFPCDL